MTAVPPGPGEEFVDVEELITSAELIDEVERQFSLLIRQARHSLQRRSAELHPGLTTLGYKVATILVREEPLPQGALAEKLGSDKATVSRTVRQLEEFALVERSPDPTDRRVMLLRLTPEGRDRVTASTAEDRRLLRSKLGTWDPEALRDFVTLLARLNQGTGRSAAPHSVPGPAVR